jgi:hypothetical protein
MELACVVLYSPCRAVSIIAHVVQQRSKFFQIDELTNKSDTYSRLDLNLLVLYWVASVELNVDNATDSGINHWKYDGKTVLLQVC